jgi:hemerythrin
MSSSASTEQIKVSAADFSRLASELDETAAWFRLLAETVQAQTAPSVDAPSCDAELAATRSFTPTMAEPYASIGSVPSSEPIRLITWSDYLSVKVPAGRGRDAVETFLPELVGYIKEHFANEEALMQKHSYPGYLDHKVKHTALTNQVLEYANRLKEEKTTAVELIKFLKNWLTAHIKNIDKKYGPYLFNKDIV